MKNNKAFTLIELLAVITLLGILITVTTISVINVVNASSESAYKTQINNIIIAAKSWSVDYIDVLPNNTNDIYELSLDTLKRNGNIENKDIINPKNNNVMNGCVVIKCGSTCKQYIYEYEERACNE